MAFDLKQTLKLSQQLLMTPQLQQAIKLLQLSRVELEEFVTDQLNENPVLEEGVTESVEEKIQYEKNLEKTEAQAANEHMESAANIVDGFSEGKKNEVDWESYSTHQESAPPIPSSQMRKDDEYPNYENIITKEGTLRDHLNDQLLDLDLDENEVQIATVITGNVDDKGYLVSSVAELSSLANVTEDEIEDILDVVQRLDPSGVGARDLKECLLIQLRNGRLKNGIVEKIIEHHLSDLETRNFPAISKGLGITIPQVIENVRIISELEPIPGRQFGPSTAQYVIPDVYVFKVADKWVVSLNEEGLPRLRVSNMYEEMLATLEKDTKADASKSKDKEENKSKGGEEKEYIKDKLKSAAWLIKSIQQRQRTIFKVTETIVERQVDFFEKGIEFLKPMILRDIADTIGMHESTISRVTNNKFVHTPLGIFELKYFFNSSISRSGGENVASASVKKMISDIIASENQKKPFADQKIVEMLEEKGIQLARRTVAKYREQLGILPSSKRKKLY